MLVFGGQIGRQLALQDAPRAGFLDGLESLQAPGAVEDRESLQIATAEFLHDHVLGLVLPSIVEGLGYLALAYALTFLAAATRARRPELVKLALYLPGHRRRADGGLHDRPRPSAGSATSTRSSTGRGRSTSAQDIGLRRGEPRRRGASRYPRSLALAAALLLVR